MSGSGARRCELCEREVEDLSKHHLIPQSRHRNKRNKRVFDRREVKERVAWLCRPCHGQVHAVLGNKELEREFNTVDRLRAHPEIARFCAWVAKRPADTKIPIRKRRD